MQYTGEHNTGENPATTSGKYIPPALRGNATTNRDKILKPLKGLMNRLSENNMHSIAHQVCAILHCTFFH